MSLSAVVLVVLAAAGFALLLWAIGRAVTAMGERAPHDHGRPRHYLAGRLDEVRIIALVDGEDEILVSLATRAASAARVSGDPLAGVFRVTARECSLARVRRWANEATPLRAYLSTDGAIMLADRVLGGNGLCSRRTWPDAPHVRRCLPACSGSGLPWADCAIQTASSRLSWPSASGILLTNKVPLLHPWIMMVIFRATVAGSRH